MPRILDCKQDGGDRNKDVEHQAGEEGAISQNEGHFLNTWAHVSVWQAWLAGEMRSGLGTCVVQRSFATHIKARSPHKWGHRIRKQSLMPPVVSHLLHVLSNWTARATILDTIGILVFDLLSQMLLRLVAEDQTSQKRTDGSIGADLGNIDLEKHSWYTTLDSSVQEIALVVDDDTVYGTPRLRPFIPFDSTSHKGFSLAQTHWANTPGDGRWATWIEQRRHRCNPRDGWRKGSKAFGTSVACPPGSWEPTRACRITRESD